MIIPIFILGCFLINVQCHQTSDNYVNHWVLIKPDIYSLFWNYSDTDITMEIHVKTNNWFIFGFNVNETLDGADVILVWLNQDGSYHFSDRHIKKNKVLTDQVQNWFAKDVTRQGPYLVAKFSRKLKICDPNQEDFDIDVGTPRVISAYGPGIFNENFDDNIRFVDFHSITFIQTLNQKINLKTPDIEIADFRVNVI